MNSNQSPIPEPNPSNSLSLMKWRLILGQKAEKEGINFDESFLQSLKLFLDENGLGLGLGAGAGAEEEGEGKEGERAGTKEGDQLAENLQLLERLESLINYVYEPKSGKKKGAGSSGSKINIPVWLEDVKEFFPNEACVVMEKDLIQNSPISELIKHPELFDKIEPNMEMLTLMLNLKNKLPLAIKDRVKTLVAKVVKQLAEKLKFGVRLSITGAIKRNMHSPVKCYRNIDWKETIRKNLKHYNPELKKVVLQTPRFYARERKKNKWKIIVAVDQSGSMTESLVHSVVIASIFATIPSITTNLVIFDTKVVDLSDQINNPVDILMSASLGGGTNITKCLKYVRGLISNPKKTLVILISDFYEGRSYHQLDEQVIAINESGAKLLGIGALSRNAKPVFNKQYARRLNKMGVDVISCTPEKLTPIISKIIQNS